MFKRKIFYVDVGNMTPKETYNYLHKLIRSMKRKR